MPSRIKFYTTGNHILLDLCKLILVSAGYEYTTSLPEATFILAGAGADLCTSIPAIILSTGNVYSCLSSSNKILEKPFNEQDPLVIPSTHYAGQQVRDILNECVSRDAMTHHAVLRIFDVYGNSKTSGIIDVFTHLLCTNIALKLPVLLSGQRKTTCLYVDDFKEVLLIFTKKFVEGLRGLYNIGSDRSITYAHLADTVYQAFTNTKEKANIEIMMPGCYVNFHAVPDITRIQAVLKWHPRTSTRKGVWTKINACKSLSSNSL